MQPRLVILLVSVMITFSCSLESKVDLKPILDIYKRYTINVIFIHNIDISLPKNIPIRIVNAVQYTKHRGFGYNELQQNETIATQYKPMFEVCGVSNLEKSLGIAQVLLYNPREEALDWSTLYFLLRSVGLWYYDSRLSRNIQLNIDVHIVPTIPGIHALDRESFDIHVARQVWGIFIWTFSNDNPSTVYIEHICPTYSCPSLVFDGIPILTGQGLNSIKETMGKVALTRRNVVVEDSGYSAVAKEKYSSFEYYASPWNKSDFFTQVVFLAVGTLSNSSIQDNRDVYQRWRSSVDCPRAKPIIISGSRHYAFISCMVIGQEKFLYTSFTVPYDLSSWVWIALSMLVTEAFVYAICKWVKKVGSNSIPPIGQFASILLDLGVRFQKKVRDMSWISWILAVWLLMSIILTNAYRGIVTSSIFAPLPQKYLDTFDDVIQHNVTLYSGYYTERANRIVKQFLEKSQSDKEEYLKYGTRWVQEDTDLTYQLDKRLQKLRGSFGTTSRRRLEKLAKLSRFEWWTLGSKHPFTKMLDCNRSAFVSLENELIGIIQENIPDQLDIDMFRRGSENILSEFYGWAVNPLPLAMDLIVASRFKAVSESGLWNFWNEVFRCMNKRCKGYILRRNGWVKVEEHPVAFTMNSNIARIFVIYLFGIMIAFIVFVKEWVKVKSIYQSCKSYICSIHQLCKRLKCWKK